MMMTNLLRVLAELIWCSLFCKTLVQNLIATVEYFSFLANQKLLQNYQYATQQTLTRDTLQKTALNVYKLLLNKN